LAITIGNDGNLYYLSRSAQALYKIIYAKTTTPYITNQPASIAVAEGQPASFNVTALGTIPLTYQWQRDGIDIPGATGATFLINNAILADEGEYQVIVSNSAGNTTSTGGMLTVIENAVPVAEIINPGLGSTYVAGTNIDFSGIGSDEEDGSLPAFGFSWQINFHHDTHNHDQPPIVGVSSGTFAIPNEGETSDNVWYRIILTVTDSQGLTGKDTIDILPQKSIISLTTDPPGLQVTVDGQPFVTPIDVTSVEGMLRSIGVITPQVIGNVTHEFESWSNGGDASQTISIPGDDLQLTATFSSVVGTEENKEFEEDVTIYPNPARQGSVTITISSRKKQNISIRLIDLLSRDVILLEQSLQPGKQSIPFSLGKASKGIYSVIIKLGDRTVAKKLAITE
jgi:hypothetical protein